LDGIDTAVLLLLLLQQFRCPLWHGDFNTPNKPVSFSTQRHHDAANGVLQPLQFVGSDNPSREDLRGHLPCRFDAVREELKHALAKLATISGTQWQFSFKPGFAPPT
jgi:hypothetical protein